MDKTERKKARRKEIRTIISYRAVEHEINTLKSEGCWAVQEDNYKRYYEASGKSFVPSKPTRLLPHVRNNTYRLLRLVEEMVLGGKSGEKEQALMHKRQETYEERLKIQYQKKYSMKGAEPNSSFKHVQKVVCGWSKEFIGKSDVSDADKEMWRTVMTLIKKSLPDTDTIDADDDAINDANTDADAINDADADTDAINNDNYCISPPVKHEEVQDIPDTISPPVGSIHKKPKQRRSGRRGLQRKYFPPATT